jgi:tetratricopeptide (TPR) repeat protein
MISIPFIFFIVLEIGLRIFNYGGDPDLFVVDKSSAEKQYILNKNFTSKYFFKKGIVTPTPLSQTFSRDKDDQTYRIFCLGASTTQGFPYSVNATFPAYLKYILKTMHPAKNFEVINCGVTAITSHSVLDIAEEIVDNYDPDLLVVYSGHNEFYGVLGQASNFILFQNYTYIRLFLKLQKLKTFLLLRDVLLNFFDEPVVRGENMDDSTLMSIIAEKTGIEINSPVYKRTEDHFRKNLEGIVKVVKNSSSKLLLCNLVGNMRDFQPFSSGINKNKINEDPLIAAFFDSAQVCQKKAKFSEALSMYQKVLDYDSVNALCHFYIAHIYESMSQPELAKKHFTYALDYDLIRFRAPSSFNHIIKQVVENSDIIFADVNTAFEKVSPKELIGNNIILEHVHPTHEGYLLIAKTIARVMSENGLIINHWDWSLNKEDDYYHYLSALTALDHEYAHYSVYRLTSFWPFPQPDEIRVYQRVGTVITENLVRKILDGKEGNIAQAHIELGKRFYEEGKLVEALAEYQAALAITKQCAVYNRIGPIYTRISEVASRRGDYKIAAGYFDTGLYYFNEGLKQCPDHLELNFNLGLLYMLRTDKFNQAVDCFNKVLTINPKHKNSMILLSKLFIRLNEDQKAQNLLMKAINLYPDEAEFYISMSTLFMKNNNQSEAGKWLEKALQKDPDNPVIIGFMNQLQAN